MTKQDPDKLCKDCAEFDYMMNRQGGVSSDVLVVCDHNDRDFDERIKDAKPKPLIVAGDLTARDYQNENDHI